MNRPFDIPARVIGLLGATALASGALLLACEGATLDEEVYVGRACTVETDCPVYLACASMCASCPKTCIERCALENEDTACFTTSGSGVCRGGLCVLNSPSGSSSSGDAGEPCAVTGEVVRSDIASSETSGLRMLTLASSHAFVQDVRTDDLGTTVLHLDAYPLDGSGAGISVAKRSANGVDLVPSPLYRAGSWIYRKSGNTSGPRYERFALPPVANAASQPVDLPGELGGAEGALFMVNGGFIVRVDGDTAVAASDPLGEIASVTLAAASRERVYWAHGSNPSTPPRTVMFAPLASGPAQATQTLLPDYVTSFFAAGTFLYFTSPNRTILRLDTATPAAQPQTLFAPDESGGQPALVSSGDAMYLRRRRTDDVTGEGCHELAKIGANGAIEKVTATLAAKDPAPFFVAFDDTFVYWLVESELRRAPK